MLFQISLPDSVTTRHSHSMPAFRMGANCVWLLITGGYTGHTTLVTGPDNLILVELGTSLVNIHVWIIIYNDSTKVLNPCESTSYNTHFHTVTEVLNISRQDFNVASI